MTIFCCGWIHFQKRPQQYIWSHELFKTLATCPQKIDSIFPLPLKLSGSLWLPQRQNTAKMALHDFFLEKIEGVPSFSCIAGGIFTGWAIREAHRSMQQNRELRNSSTQICPTDFLQRCKSSSVKEWSTTSVQQLTSIKKNIKLNLNLTLYILFSFF